MCQQIFDTFWCIDWACFPKKKYSEIKFPQLFLCGWGTNNQERLCQNYIPVHRVRKLPAMQSQRNYPRNYA